jgi:hypothetical protein
MGLFLRFQSIPTPGMIAAQLVACRSGIGPKDELEGMMAAQLIAAHNAAMECYRRAMISEQSFEGRREPAPRASSSRSSGPTGRRIWSAW